MTDVPTFLATLAPLPVVDFAEFGEIETCKLSRIQQLTGAFLGRNWVTIPHVTHHDEVDVTEMEARRQTWNAEHAPVKATPLALLVRAVAAALIEFPKFNASIDGAQKTLVLKKYVNVGVAVDTPNGLLVPVIKGVPHKGLTELIGDISALAEKARTKGLPMADMTGSSMCVSSLGHIGGTAFTPIINAPDVAILGVTALQLRPAPGPDNGIIWRKMLPLSLSYDHRVINGADAARFVRFIGAQLASPEIFT
jgi:pyruvate dehydrogenase E2 component (dihydrolipoamide acetyltransferase)